MSSQRTIALVEEDDGWTAIDEETGLECRGEERETALERLDDAVAISFDGEPDGENDAEPAADEALEWFEE
ncbi:hypothetical protein L593_09980 [Salinarchaeum sp. Harcht-Bsk1]|uniref:type II toxin-antitoxin system HicB family antitoxin n=1 Tax=Salinarchaeum sp. Harcht-Bsk1 TaxID=1333523 RepID=UPI0003424930|nr:hypothetical protein [Salinarchaeum sp. Harcht-Bsk1]AGN01941.1 hypothetical protein L593_09980 [Salinarchaeum sp. Harcht-Bsk1]